MSHEFCKQNLRYNILATVSKDHKMSEIDRTKKEFYDKTKQKEKASERKESLYKNKFQR